MKNLAIWVKDMPFPVMCEAIGVDPGGYLVKDQTGKHLYVPLTSIRYIEVKWRDEEAKKTIDIEANKE